MCIFHCQRRALASGSQNTQRACSRLRGHGRAWQFILEKMRAWVILIMYPGKCITTIMIVVNRTYMCLLHRAILLLLRCTCISKREGHFHILTRIKVACLQYGLIVGWWGFIPSTQSFCPKTAIFSRFTIIQIYSCSHRLMTVLTINLSVPHSLYLDLSFIQVLSLGFYWLV